mgnify:CR=1 FL=1
MSRFGQVNISEIDAVVQTNVPINTVRSKKSISSQFESFCQEGNYSLMDRTSSLEEINTAFKDWGFNTRKKDGSDHKECVLNLMWNSVANFFFKLIHFLMSPLKQPEKAETRKGGICKWNLNFVRTVLLLLPNRR